MDDESIILTLTQVKGIGRWTVQMLLIFRIDMTSFPLMTLGHAENSGKVYGLDELSSRYL